MSDEHDLHARMSVAEERVEALRQESDKHDQAHTKIFKQIDCIDKKLDVIQISIAEMRGAWAATKILAAIFWTFLGATVAAFTYWLKTK